VTLFSVGQSLLLALEDRTRASGTFVTRAGPALLAPDSNLYLSLAASSESLLGSPWPRMLYPLLLSVGNALGNATLFVVVLQSVAAVLAGLALHTVTAQATNEFGGVAASAVLLVNPLTAQWVRFILTDLLFLCLIIAAVVFASRFQEDLDRRAGAGVLISGVLALMLRPNGVLVLGSGLACLVLARSATRSGRATAFRLLSVSFVTALVLIAAAGASGPPAEGTLTSQFYDGIVVEGTDDVRVTITMPPHDDRDDKSIRPVAQYIARHPVAALRLVLARPLVEVTQLRPHYPMPINLAVGIIMLTLIAVSVVGSVDTRAKILRRTGAMFALPLLALIGATFASPEGRYGWAPLIALAPLAGIGVARVGECILGLVRPEVSAGGQVTGTDA
jgi:hypothetical protein